MRALQKTLPSKKETRFLQNLDDKPNTPPNLVEGWLEEIGQSPEALRGCMFSLEAVQLITQGMYQTAVEMKNPTYCIAVRRMFLMLLNLRVELAAHPYMQEALAILKEEDDASE